jgi:L-threonylcarbamoyladenylate synthase
MKRLFWNNPATIDYVEKELRAGRVILAEGDTVFGLLADVSENGYAQLDSIKNRSKKPYLLLVSDKQKAFNLIKNDEGKIYQIEKIMNICWPGPATLIFRASAGVSRGVASSEDTVAIRIPDHLGLLNLLSRFDGLFSTSANLAGESVPTDIQEVDDSIMQTVACVVLNDNPSKSILPSTIIDCTGEKIKIVREGAFSIEKLAELLK